MNIALAKFDVFTTDFLFQQPYVFFSNCAGLYLEGTLQIGIKGVPVSEQYLLFTLFAMHSTKGGGLIPVVALNQEVPPLPQLLTMINIAQMCTTFVKLTD